MFGVCWDHPWLFDLHHILLDWKVARSGVLVSTSLVLTREGERIPTPAFHRSHYINRIWLSSSTGASAPLVVPCVHILFCPRELSWVMDRAEPSNAWCNCQRDLIIRTLHAGLLCPAISSLLSGNLEAAWITGGGVLQKVSNDAFAHLLPVWKHWTTVTYFTC